MEALLAAGRCRPQRSRKWTLAASTNALPSSRLETMCCSESSSKHRFGMSVVCVCVFCYDGASTVKISTQLSNFYFCAVSAGCGDACCVPHIAKSIKAVDAEPSQKAVLSPSPMQYWRLRRACNRRSMAHVFSTLRLESKIIPCLHRYK